MRLLPETIAETSPLFLKRLLGVRLPKYSFNRSTAKLETVTCFALIDTVEEQGTLEFTESALFPLPYWGIACSRLRVLSPRALARSSLS
jgi:hypothetical protein